MTTTLIILTIIQLINIIHTHNKLQHNNNSIDNLSQLHNTPNILAKKIVHNKKLLLVNQLLNIISITTIVITNPLLVILSTPTSWLYTLHNIKFNNKKFLDNSQFLLDNQNLDIMTKQLLLYKADLISITSNTSTLNKQQAIELTNKTKILMQATQLLTQKVNNFKI